MLAASTMERILELAALPASAVPDRAGELAKLSLFDWTVCALAGSGEPVSRIIRDFVVDEGGRAEASVVGSAIRVPPRAAALANGTISHALDYDDTHFAHVGHLSVAIAPAVLAVAEPRGASGADVRHAFVLGAEAACRIGVTLGRGHYERGFHQTATAGAFGATVAAGRLLGLSAGEMRHALSLVATRASGLKSQFGTMGKPFNAGIAASNGVEAVLLASRGMISCADGLGGAQGFIDTHASESFEDRAWAAPLSEKFLFEDNMYKLHACCHGTHAMINALSEGRQAGIDAENVKAIALRTNPRWLKVCDIKEPRTGLEAKFSYALLAAMTLSGIDTAADRTYSDEICKDPRLLALAARVAVEGDAQVSDTQARVTVERSDDSKVELHHDLAVPAKISDLEHGLRRKAIALLGDDRSQMLWSAIAQIDSRNAKDITALLAA